MKTYPLNLVMIVFSVFTLWTTAPLLATDDEVATEEAVASNLSNRVSALEDQNRDLMGSLEESQHAVKDLQAQLERALSDVEMRLAALEGHGGATEASSTSTEISPITPTAVETPLGTAEDLPISLGEGVRKDASGNVLGTLGAASSGVAAGAATALVGASPEKKDTPEAQYEKARVLLEKGEYEGAEKAFSAFVKDHPKHELAGKAQYWLGVTYYVRENYEPAAAAFAKGYKVYGKSEKAPDMLLKMAKALEAMNRQSDACKALAELGSSHPKAHKEEVTKLVKSLSCKN